MTKADLIEKLSENGFTKAEAKKAAESVLDAITGELAKGERVTLQGLGTFEVKASEPRQGRNPRTGDPVAIPAHNRVRFRPGKALKEAVNS